MAKYKDYRKALFNGNRVGFETIKGGITLPDCPFKLRDSLKSRSRES